MSGVTADQVLGWLEHEPAAPFSATTLRHLAGHPTDHLWRPRWWRLETPKGLPTLGLVAMQVASGGHPQRLQQAWEAWSPRDTSVSLQGDLPLGGLLWLVGARTPRLTPWATDTLIPHWMAHGGTVDAVWRAAWQASNTMRTQNAVDLPWNDLMLAWAKNQDHLGPRPSPAVAADLALTWVQANLRELTLERVWDRHITADPPSSLIPWLVIHTTQPAAAGAWLTQLLERKRKTVPVLDQALCELIRRGTTVPLPKRAAALVPEAVDTRQATERAQQADVQAPLEASRGRRMRS